MADCYVLQWLLFLNKLLRAVFFLALIKNTARKKTTIYIKNNKVALGLEILFRPPTC